MSNFKVIHYNFYSLCYITTFNFEIEAQKYFNSIDNSYTKMLLKVFDNNYCSTIEEYDPYDSDDYEFNVGYDSY